MITMQKVTSKFQRVQSQSADIFSAYRV